ncbi:MAG: hypothetical protein CMJ75_12905 [Planctomycetaceae bacterium]|nr:hypothetical protein [Planctomycetaceae bacterium]
MKFPHRSSPIQGRLTGSRQTIREEKTARSYRQRVLLLPPYLTSINRHPVRNTGITRHDDPGYQICPETNTVFCYQIILLPNHDLTAGRH